MCDREMVDQICSTLRGKRVTAISLERRKWLEGYRVGRRPGPGISRARPPPLSCRVPAAQVDRGRVGEELPRRAALLLRAVPAALRATEGDVRIGSGGLGV